jgi:hypothetical protein
MAGLVQALQQQVLDSTILFPVTAATDHIAYSANGTGESAALARTPVGATGWAAATAATPSVKANNAILTSAAASAAATITHWAVYSALTAGTQKLDWTPLDSPRTLGIGDSIQWAVGAAKITLD